MINKKQTYYSYFKSKAHIREDFYFKKSDRELMLEILKKLKDEDQKSSKVEQAV